MQMIKRAIKPKTDPKINAINYVSFNPSSSASIVGVSVSSHSSFPSVQSFSELVLIALPSIREFCKFLYNGNAIDYVESMSNIFKLAAYSYLNSISNIFKIIIN